MHPVLLKIGPLTLHTYGFFVALGFILGLTWCGRESRRRGLDPEIFQDLFFYVVIAAVLGARLLYVALNFSYFRSAPLAVFRIWEGGLVFYGGFIAALPVLVWRLRYWRKPVLQILDIAAPGLVLAQAVGRLGCLAAGCCYGKVCSGPLAITFSDPLSHAPLHLPLYPTQIFHAVANFLIFLFLAWLSRRRFSTRGLVTVAYCLLYGSCRFVIEFWRGDPRGFYAGLSTSQWISLLLLAGGVVLWWMKVKGADDV